MRYGAPPFIGVGGESRGQRESSMAGDGGHSWHRLWGEEEGATLINGGKRKRRSSGIGSVQRRWPEAIRAATAVLAEGSCWLSV
jgi:hypothetical protein